jgi:hypothetical protein
LSQTTIWPRADLATLVAQSDWGWLVTEAEWKAEHEAFEQASRGMTLRKLRALSDDELISYYDPLMAPRQNAFVSGPDDYLNELRRRETDRQTTWLVRLTWVIAALTVVLVALELVPRIAGAGH